MEKLPQRILFCYFHIDYFLLAKSNDFLGIQKFDTEKLREIIKVIRVHGQNEIEIKWNFDDIFSEQR